LWLSACGGEVHRLAAADITKSNDKAMSDVLIAGLTDNEGIAFDKAGNLWIAGGGVLSRFDAARLDMSTSDAADLTLAVTMSVGGTKVGGSELAFDQGGNLWGVDVGLAVIFQVADTALTQTGSKAVMAEHAFPYDSQALASGIAFDEGNGLWLSLTAGTFGRYSAAQLATNKGTGTPVVPETVIKSSSVDSELPVAFFPAPSGLPLYHAIPMP
jgi:sugar lactone lactonase YvrE